jgi:hypothetical protein
VKRKKRGIEKRRMAKVKRQKEKEKRERQIRVILRVRKE